MRRPVMRRRGAPLLAAAAVGGVSYMAGKSTARRSAEEAQQDQRLQELEQAQMYGQPQAMPSRTPQAAAVAPTSQDRLTRLKELADLKNAGVLTEPEFEMEKQRILTSP